MHVLGALRQAYTRNVALHQDQAELSYLDATFGAAMPRVSEGFDAAWSYAISSAGRSTVTRITRTPQLHRGMKKAMPRHRFFGIMRELLVARHVGPFNPTNRGLLRICLSHQPICTCSQNRVVRANVLPAQRTKAGQQPRLYLRIGHWFRQTTKTFKSIHGSTSIFRCFI